ncbi:hypothetical protein Dsin_006432 [Dipteronia sinensis]|uniref:Small auxin up regulated protein n=1 Tax=Dipteronia sinensis TaxID=43782 RepID=A0AAE0EHF9_9ROSI|nr:hypothetical protein Dsin_006432 [Dipteronia sinensis]
MARPIKRLFVEKLHKGFSFLAPTTMVPDDVKEGHFVVFAVKGEETERFVIELCLLTSPEFLRLLEEAEEEFGFKQKGALTIPCRPQELHRIILQGRCEIFTSAGAGMGFM